MKLIRISIVLVLGINFLLIISACGGKSGDATLAESRDPVERGRTLYESSTIGPNKAPGCKTCHSLEADRKIVGPSMAGIAIMAQSNPLGSSAEEFLRQSIVNPDEYVLEGFPAGVMYKRYEQDLSPQQVEDLVAFLMSLK